MLSEAELVREEFAERASSKRGKLSGCWRSLVGLGMGREEGIAATSWPAEELARGASAVDGAEHHVLEATVRPKKDLEHRACRVKHNSSLYRLFTSCPHSAGQLTAGKLIGLMSFSLARRSRRPRQQSDSPRYRIEGLGYDRC